MGLVIAVVIALFLYCTFKIHSAIRLSSRMCLINSVFSVYSCYCTRIQCCFMPSDIVKRASLQWCQQWVCLSVRPSVTDCISV